VNLLGYNIDTTKKNTETLIDASKEVGPEINVEKTKYMLVSHHQNVGKNRDIEIANNSFENVSQFKYLRTTVTNQNLIQEKIKRSLNSGIRMDLGEVGWGDVDSIGQVPDRSKVESSCEFGIEPSGSMKCSETI
jgi:hypothetical protein